MRKLFGRATWFVFLGATTPIFIVSIVLIIWLSWDRVGSVEISQQAASLIFAAVTVQIGIAISFTNIAWKAFCKISAVIPLGERRLKFDLRKIDDPIVKERSLRLLSLGVGVIFLSISIVCHLGTLLGIGDVILGLKPGVYSDDNFKWGVFAAEWGSLFFIFGLVSAGIAFAQEATAFMAGSPSFLYVSQENRPDDG